MDQTCGLLKARFARRSDSRKSNIIQTQGTQNQPDYMRSSIGVEAANGGQIQGSRTQSKGHCEEEILRAK